MYLASSLARHGVAVKTVNRMSPGYIKQVPKGSLLIMAGPHTSGSIPAYQKKNCRIIFWTLDVPQAFNRTELFNTCTDAAETVVASADWGLRGSSKTIPFCRIPAAVPNIPIKLFPIPERPIAFLGTIYSDRRKKIAAIVKKHGGEVRSSANSRIYGLALANYSQSTKILIGDNWTNDVEGYWSSRNYILPGLGAFLLTAHVPGIQREFTPGTHMATWKDLDELEEKIDLFLRHEEERERIRQAGFEYARLAHTWDLRAVEFIDVIRKMYGIKHNAD